MKNSLAIATCILGALATPCVAADPNPNYENVSKLLSEAKSLAFQVKEDASALEGYSRSGSSWELHSAALAQMREHINALGKQVTKLEEARKTAAPWQNAAIERVRPALVEMAYNAGIVIDYITNNQKRVNVLGEFKDYVEANADLADELSGLVADFVDYGKTRQRLADLAKKLELPAPAVY